MRRLPLSSLEPGSRTLPAPSAHYVARVLRVRVGEAVEVFDPKAGTTATARVTSIGADVVITIEAVRDGEESEPLVLLQGYPKGDKLGDIVRDATELGATLIVPTICARSIARPEAGSAKGERWAAIAAEAARQSGRARGVEITPPVGLADALAIAREHAPNGFTLYEKATTPLGPDLLSARGGVAFLIGPEGGLTEDEVTSAERAGFVTRSLGAGVLRTETAATAVLGAYRICSTR